VFEIVGDGQLGADGLGEIVTDGDDDGGVRVVRCDLEDLVGVGLEGIHHRPIWEDDVGAVRREVIVDHECVLVGRHDFGGLELVVTVRDDFDWRCCTPTHEGEDNEDVKEHDEPNEKTGMHGFFLSIILPPFVFDSNQRNCRS